jgi:predicted ATPase/class 3 adenylate cyclase
MELADWLRSLGLEKYEAAFRENEIDESVLPNLTAGDLKDLGVTAVGHRRKLLEAIRQLGSETSAGPTSTNVSPPTPTNDATAERRHVTVMFSDLVGSTAMSGRMDPEDLREIISAYQKCVAESVQRFGGFVAKFMGDGVLIYFGYPQAHEDDAERAVRAGLETVAAVGNLKIHAPLQTRVGIATGLVVVGDLIGSGASQEQAIVGETPNLAARLQGVAEPNSVVISESARRLLGNLFELADLGARELKGIAGLVRAWAVLRTASIESRFEALRADALTDLIGRGEELALLLRRWSRAKDGEGQVVLLSGEPGIGKSRLTAALMQRVDSEPHTRLRYFCSPQHTDSALYPIISHTERTAGFARDDTAKAKLDKLDTLLAPRVAPSSTPLEDKALVAEMLSLPNDGRYPLVKLGPQQRRQKTLEALTAQLEALSRSNPVLMIFEDVHWIDPTSLEVLGRVVDQIRSAGVLLIITYRPEFEAAWIGRSHVTALILNRLGGREIAAIVDGVAGDALLPESVRQDIIERTDGIPLFVEEITKAVLEAVAEDASEHTAAAISSIRVPASLHASLMARLDRLGAAKEIAQIGAAIGREFSHALLAAVVRKPEAALKSDLDRLVDTGLLFRQGVTPHITYAFKHALVQDAAYGTLLRERRRALHARIAEMFESHFADVAETQPELLARHCTEAGQIEKAAGLWGKSGRRSLERSALIEATHQLTQAADQLATLATTPAIRREQLGLQVALLTPLMQVKGHAAPETVAAAERARSLIEEAEALGEPPDDPLLLFLVLYGFWVQAHGAFDSEAMLSLAEQFLKLAEKQGATVPLMIGHRLVGSSFALTGRLAEGRAHYDQAIALYDPLEHRSLTTRFGQDVGVANLAYRSLAVLTLGYPDAARKDTEDAVQNARDIGHDATLILALIYKALVHMQCGSFETTNDCIDEFAGLAERAGAVFWQVGARLSRGCILVHAGKNVEAAQMLSSNLVGYRSMGTKMLMPFWLPYLSRAQACVGHFDLAWQSINEALTIVQTSGERWFEAEVIRSAGELSLLQSQPDAQKAEALFQRALAVARQHEARSWELRAAVSLARLWQAQGRLEGAYELLIPVYDRFTEGFDTLDLKDAKALLKMLAEHP